MLLSTPASNRVPGRISADTVITGRFPNPEYNAYPPGKIIGQSIEITQSYFPKMKTLISCCEAPLICPLTYWGYMYVSRMSPCAFTFPLRRCRNATGQCFDSVKESV